MIDNILNGVFDDAGFALLVFERSTLKNCNWISNIKRAEVLELLREEADRIEAGDDMPPTVGGNIH